MSSVPFRPDNRPAREPAGVAELRPLARCVDGSLRRGRFDRTNVVQGGLVPFERPSSVPDRRELLPDAVGGGHVSLSSPLPTGARAARTIRATSPMMLSIGISGLAGASAK